MDRIERIRAMEEKFDALAAVAARLANAAEAYEQALPLLEELTDYYTGGQWLSDYEADEAGLIPHDLKRGVLSQDGLYDLLSDLQRVRDIISPQAESEPTE